MNTRNSNLPFILSAVLLFIYLTPYIFFPGTAHFLLHDNLDSQVCWYKMLSESGLTFASNNAVFHTLYDGIPRGCMPSELDLATILFLAFPALAAYCILIILQRVVALVGMYRLLNDYLFKGKYPYHAALISLVFALLPFWPFGVFCVAGQPLVIWALLNLFHSKKSIYNWLIIILFPFCSSHFVFSNIFFLPGLFVGMMCMFIYSKSFNKAMFLGWCVLLVLSVASEYRLFFMQFVDKVASQRGSYHSGELLNWKGYLKTDILFFLKGQYHFYSNQYPVIIITVLLSLLLVRNTMYYRVIGIILAFTFLISTADTLHTWSASTAIFGKLGSLKTLQIRFVSLYPVIWTILFSVAIFFTLNKNPKLQLPALLLVAAQVILLFLNVNSDFQNSEYAENAFYYTYIKPHDGSHKSFEAYYSPSIFGKVKNEINYHNETTLCIGFPSEMAQYNGFHTAAGYLDFYPAINKLNLAAVFSPGLNKVENSNQRQGIIGERKFQYYYSNAGDSGKTAINLDVDTNALNNMHIKYVLSGKAILNHSANHWQPIDSIKNAGQAALFVYKVN